MKSEVDQCLPSRRLNTDFSCKLPKAKKEEFEEELNSIRKERLNNRRLDRIRERKIKYQREKEEARRKAEEERLRKGNFSFVE